MSGLNYIHNSKKLLEEDSLISYPLVKKEKKGGGEVTHMILLHYGHKDVKDSSLWAVQSAA